MTIGLILHNMFKRAARILRLIVVEIIKAPIWVYHYAISPWLGSNCRFSPTCSAYAREALDRHGPIKGLFLALRRVFKCHPLYECNFVDPVPEAFDWGDMIGYKRGVKAKKHSKTDQQTNQK